MSDPNSRGRYWSLGGALIGVTLLALLVAVRPADGGSVAAAPTADQEEPAHVEEIEGTDLHEVTLTEDAAARIGLRTDTVGARGSGDRRLLVVSYGALLYDPAGGTWVYVSTDDLTFRRAPVRVQDIVGEQVLLSRGPAPGAEVVTVAGAELWGAEFGVGH